MVLIEDVRNELKTLDDSPKKLRRFGLIVGVAFIAIGVVLLFRGVKPWWMALGSLGLILAVVGLVAPRILPGVHRVWMGFAFVIGWMVSRALLVVLFFLVIAPFGLIVRIMGKELMDINLKKRKGTYWIERNGIERETYEKLF